MYLPNRNITQTDRVNYKHVRNAKYKCVFALPFTSTRLPNQLVANYFTTSKNPKSNWPADCLFSTHETGVLYMTYEMTIVKLPSEVYQSYASSTLSEKNSESIKK